MNRKSLLVTGAMCSAALIFASCARRIATVESDHFRVEVSQLIDYLDVNVCRKASGDAFRTLLSIELGLAPGLGILDDSILVVTGIDATIDGEPGLIANLQDDEVAELTFGVGDHSLMDDTKELQSLQAGDWNAYAYRMTTRADMFITRVRLPDQWKRPLQSIVLLGVEAVELQSIEDGLLEFVITWPRSHSRQQFRVAFSPSGPMTPDRFSVVR